MGARQVMAFLVLFTALLPLRSGALAGPPVGPAPLGRVFTKATGNKISPATMPQFWLTDASIFIHNAASVLSGIFAEQRLGTRDSELLANQARTALHLLVRARESLRMLEANAEASNPGAVVAIRSALAEVTAAENKLATGTLRPGKLRPVLAHLRIAARKQMPVVAQKYLDRNAALAFIPLDGPEQAGRNMAGVSRSGAPEKRN